MLSAFGLPRRHSAFSSRPTTGPGKFQNQAEAAMYCMQITDLFHFGIALKFEVGVMEVSDDLMTRISLELLFCPLDLSSQGYLDHGLPLRKDRWDPYGTPYGSVNS